MKERSWLRMKCRLVFIVVVAYGTLAAAIPIAGFYDHRVAAVPERPTTELPRFAILNRDQDEEAENNRDAARRLEAVRPPCS